MMCCGYETPWSFSTSGEEEEEFTVWSKDHKHIVEGLKDERLARHIAAIPNMVDFICILNKSMADVYDTIEFIGTEAESIIKQVKS